MSGSPHTKFALLPLVALATALALGNAPADAAAGPVSAARPAIAGTLQQGKRLIGTPGTWTGSGTISYAYQWYRCNPSGASCSSIHGSTKATYTTVAKDIGQTVALAVRATDSTGTTVAYSALAGLVAAPTATFAATVQPTLTGSTAVGQVLTVTGGTFTTTPGSLIYSWLECNANGRLCTPLAGATTDSYTVMAADSGHTIVGVVTATVGTSTVDVLTTIAAIP